MDRLLFDTAEPSRPATTKPAGTPLLEQYLTWAKFKRRYLKTRLQAVLYRRVVASVEKHCVFVGYPRSGHTLIGALLDAHPNIIISNGVDPMQYLERGFAPPQLFCLYVRQSRRFARTERKSGGYSYVVPNQWHGRFSALKVVGDKSGDLLTARLRSEPQQLDQLLRHPGVEHKFLHVVRNPYDNIATCSARNGISLPHAIDYYFSLCETVAAARRKVGEANWLDIWHEAVIDDPRLWLLKLLNFLGQQPSEDYLRDCASIVYKEPNKSRFTAPWTPRLISRVEIESRKYAHLCEYRFDS
jgi:hypothetical protein